VQILRCLEKFQISVRWHVACGIVSINQPADNPKNLNTGRKPAQLYHKSIPAAGF
jgi:hypothetical protein